MYAYIFCYFTSFTVKNVALVIVIAFLAFQKIKIACDQTAFAEHSQNKLRIKSTFYIQRKKNKNKCKHQKVH